MKWTKLKIFALVLFLVGKIILLASFSLITGFAIASSSGHVSFRIIGCFLIALGLALFVLPRKEKEEE